MFIELFDDLGDSLDQLILHLEQSHKLAAAIAIVSLTDDMTVAPSPRYGQRVWILALQLSSVVITLLMNSECAFYSDLDR